MIFWFYSHKISFVMNDDQLKMMSVYNEHKKNLFEEFPISKDEIQLIDMLRRVTVIKKTSETSSDQEEVLNFIK